MMKTKILLITACMLLGYTSSFAGWCKVSSEVQLNVGYCSENLQGKGVCVGVEMKSAKRCSADGGTDEEISVLTLN